MVTEQNRTEYLLELLAERCTGWCTKRRYTGEENGLYCFLCKEDVGRGDHAQLVKEHGRRGSWHAEDCELYLPE